MAAGNKYILTLTSHSADNPDNTFANVFAYEAGLGDTSAADLAATFQTDVLLSLTDVCAAVTFWDMISVTNLDNASDFDDLPVGNVGNVAGDYLPVFNAWEFEYVHGTRAVHSGRKALSIVPESFQTNGVATSAALTQLADIENAMIATLEGASGGIYIPRIWRRAGLYGSPPVSFPDTFFPVKTVKYRRISTQNTRKR